MHQHPCPAWLPPQSLQAAAVPHQGPSTRAVAPAFCHKLPFSRFGFSGTGFSVSTEDVCCSSSCGSHATSAACSQNGRRPKHSRPSLHSVSHGASGSSKRRCVSIRFAISSAWCIPQGKTRRASHELYSQTKGSYAPLGQGVSTPPSHSYVTPLSPTSSASSLHPACAAVARTPHHQGQTTGCNCQAASGYCLARY